MPSSTFQSHHDLLEKDKKEGIALKGIIYLLTNSLNSKVYVGQTRRTLGRRWYEHVWFSTKENNYLSRAIRKYGPETFRMKVIVTVFEETEEELVRKLNVLESAYIRKYNSFADSGRGYNLTTGGDVFVVSERTRQLMSENNSGPKHPQFGKEKSKATKIKIRNTLKGRVIPEKIRKNMSRTYRLHFHGGRTLTVCGLKRFCNRAGYDRKNLYRVMVGKQPFHKDVIEVEKIDV